MPHRQTLSLHRIESNPKATSPQLSRLIKSEGRASRTKHYIKYVLVDVVVLLKSSPLHLSDFLLMGTRGEVFLRACALKIIIRFQFFLGGENLLSFLFFSSIVRACGTCSFRKCICRKLLYRLSEISVNVPFAALSSPVIERGACPPRYPRPRPRGPTMPSSKQ